MILKQFIKESAKSCIPLVAIVALWAVVSLFFDALIFPSPLETMAGWERLATSEFQAHLGVSLIRISLGAVASLILGTIIAIVARSVAVHPYIESCMTMFQVLPGLIIAVIFLLLFGVGSFVPIFLIIFMVTPLIAVNTSAVLAQKENVIDKVVSFYAKRGWATIRDLYLPRLVPCMRANCILAMTMALKVCLLGEFIGSQNGLGYLINISRMYFDMEAVFFYIAVILLLIFLFQLIVRSVFHLFLGKFFY